MSRQDRIERLTRRLRVLERQQLARLCGLLPPISEEERLATEYREWQDLTLTLLKLGTHWRLPMEIAIEELQRWEHEMGTCPQCKGKPLSECPGRDWHLTHPPWWRPGDPPFDWRTMFRWKDSDEEGPP